MMADARAAIAATTALLLGMLPPAVLPAQEAGPRGWLGVGVQEVAECRVENVVRDRCSSIAKRLIVTQVIVDGPADLAGVQVGDTLLALDGRRLDQGLTDDAFAALRPGEPVRLDVGRRDGARSTLRVVPAERPSGRVAVRVPGDSEGTRVVRQRLVAPTPPQAEPPEGRRLIIRAQPGGVYQIQPHVEVTVEGPDGEGRRLIVVDPARVAEAAIRGRESLVRRLREGETGRGGLELEGGRYVLLDPGPELGALQDSIFRAARQQLDSLQRALAKDVRFRALVEDVRVAGPRRFVLTNGFGRGVAGAEFEPLSRELAEFFDGAEEGLLCLRVLSDTPAARLGLRPGDVVVEAAGRPVASLEELRSAFRRVGSEPVQVRWVRKGRTMEGVLRYE